MAKASDPKAGPGRRADPPWTALTRYRLAPIGWWVLAACVVSAILWALIITGVGWWLGSRLPHA